MRRRKIIVAIVALLSIGGFAVWRITHRHDSRLVGTWVETDSRWPTTDELERVANGDQLHPLTQWQLRADGSGNVANMFMYGAGPCRWRTQGDRLFVRYQSEKLSLREEIGELWGTLCGDRPKPWREYRIVFESAWRVRLEFGDPEQRQSHWENRLTRIEGPGE
jgi:hypothetical protein